MSLYVGTISFNRFLWVEAHIFPRVEHSGEKMISTAATTEINEQEEGGCTASWPLCEDI